MAALEGDALAADIASRGVAFGQLLQFVWDNNLNDPAHKDWTTAKVVREIIIPATHRQRCCFADVMPGVAGKIAPGRKSPRILISHWWGNRFLDLVRAIASIVGCKETLELRAFTTEQLRDSLWLCIFGVNQHVSICGTEWNPCPCRGEQFKDGSRCEMNKFAEVMRHIPEHALAMDASLVTFKRIWVLSELAEALQSGKDTRFAGRPTSELLHAAVFEQRQVVSPVQHAEATYTSDQEMILDEIARNLSFDAFDKLVWGKVHRELVAMRGFAEVVTPGRGAAARLVTQRCPPHGPLERLCDARHELGGDHICHWPGEVCTMALTPQLVALLLRHPQLVRAQNHADGKRGFLHYALGPRMDRSAQATRSRDTAVRSLLLLRADPLQSDSEGHGFGRYAARFFLKQVAEDRTEAFFSELTAKPHHPTAPFDLFQALPPRWFTDLLSVGMCVEDACDAPLSTFLDKSEHVKAMEGTVDQSAEAWPELRRCTALQDIWTQVENRGPTFLAHLRSLCGSQDVAHDELNRTFSESPDVVAVLQHAEEEGHAVGRRTPSDKGVVAVGWAPTPRKL